jgi:hypothetical protein
VVDAWLNLSWTPRIAHLNPNQINPDHARSCNQLTAGLNPNTARVASALTAATTPSCPTVSSSRCRSRLASAAAAAASTTWWGWSPSSGVGGGGLGARGGVRGAEWVACDFSYFVSAVAVSIAASDEKGSCSNGDPRTFFRRYLYRDGDPDAVGPQQVHHGAGAAAVGGRRAGELLRFD